MFFEILLITKIFSTNILKLIVILLRFKKNINACLKKTQCVVKRSLPPHELSFLFLATKRWCKKGGYSV